MTIMMHQLQAWLEGAIAAGEQHAKEKDFDVGMSSNHDDTYSAGSAAGHLSACREILIMIKGKRAEQVVPVEPKAELRRFWLLYVDGWFCSVSCSEAQAQAASDVNKENGVCYTKELILTFEELKAKCVGAADASQLAWAWNAAKVVPAKVPVFAGEEK